MNRYFVNREGAVRRLMAIRQGDCDTGRADFAIVGQRRDGSEVTGVDAVLADARACRLLHFRYINMGSDEIVFIS